MALTQIKTNKWQQHSHIRSLDLLPKTPNHQAINIDE